MTKAVKYILDMTPIGIIDDVSGAFFGFITTALIISFCINIFQYFDIAVFEKEIKGSVISFYLLDFAPNTFAYFIDFFPSLEFIVENNESKKLTKNETDYYRTLWFIADKCIYDKIKEYINLYLSFYLK